jgi:hypothetical protein
MKKIFLLLVLAIAIASCEKTEQPVMKKVVIISKSPDYGKLLYKVHHIEKGVVCYIRSEFNYSLGDTILTPERAVRY